MASLSILRILTVLLTLGLQLTHAAHHIPLRKSETDGSTYLQNWQKRGHIIARRDIHKNWQDSQYHRRADGIIERHHTSRSTGSRRRSQPHLAAYKRSRSLDGSIDNRPRDETDGGWFATLTRSLAGSPIINAESTSLSNSVTQPSASNQPSGASVSNSQNSAPGQPTGTQSAGVPQSPQPFLPIEYVGSYAWTIDMKFGPEQVVAPILVDTGSPVLWTASKQCTLCLSSQMVGAVDLDTNACTTPDVTLQFGTGRSEGCYKKTRIDLGGYVLEDYAVLGVKTIDPVMAKQGDTHSGIWGLSNKMKYNDTPVDVLAQKGQIASPVVGFYLTRDDNPEDSQVVIGAPENLEDESLPINVQSKVVLSKMNTGNTHYNVKMDSLGAWGRSSTNAQLQNVEVTMDTGTTFFNIPSMAAASIYSEIGNGTTWQDPGSGYYVLPCNMVDPTDKVVNMQYGGKSFGIQFRDTILDEVPNYPGWCFGSFFTIVEDRWIMGGTLLVNFFHTVNPTNGEVVLYELTK